MDSYFNNFLIDLDERAAIPRSFSFTTGVKSAEKLKDFLWKVIHNEKTNRELYLRMLDKGFDVPIYITDQAIELLPGKFIKVYFVLRDGTKNAPRGTSGFQGLIFKESRIVISLYADVEEDRLLWSDSYGATIDHELTHAFQSMDVAIRYLQAKNRKNPNYQPSYDEILKWMTKVNVKNSTFNKRFRGKESDPNKYLAYLASDREMGARAHALLRQLYAKDRGLYNDVISYFDTGWPDFDYLNRRLSKNNWHGWAELTNFERKEMQSFGIADYETQAFALKQELLDRMYNIYNVQYRR